MWLWQGWWPTKQDEDADNTDEGRLKGGDQDVEEDEDAAEAASTTGSALLRFNFARKAALETTLNYARQLGPACKVGVRGGKGWLGEVR